MTANNSLITLFSLGGGVELELDYIWLKQLNILLPPLNLREIDMYDLCKVCGS